MWSWLKDRWMQVLGVLAALGGLLAFWTRLQKGQPLPVEQTDEVLEEAQEDAQQQADDARADADGHAQAGELIEAELLELEETHAQEEDLSDEDFAKQYNERHRLRDPDPIPDRER